MPDPSTPTEWVTTMTTEAKNPLAAMTTAEWLAFINEVVADQIDMLMERDRRARRGGLEPV